MRNTLVLGETHILDAQRHFAAQNGREGAGYLFCGVSEVKTDPWSRRAVSKFLVRHFEPLSAEGMISSSHAHVSWDTRTFVHALRRLRDENETIAILHNHPGGLGSFSEQDDRNEAELLALVAKRNGHPTRMLSVVMLPDGRLFGRVWVTPMKTAPLDLIMVSGKRLALHYAGRGNNQPVTYLNRQTLALGKAFNNDLARLRIGIIGCGATGSAVSMLLPRLGVKHIALFDQDAVDETNLNRLHFSSASDVKLNHPKIEVIKRGIDAMELGTEVRCLPGWINNIANREALKSSDVIFGCTDDNAGRLLLNRFAYFYRTPVIDMGLAIKVGEGDPPRVQAFDGRVTVLQPGTTCLLCRGIIDPERAHAESLKRTDPAEYDRQKKEAYVVGEGNPSPAVVPFTTEVAAMAVEELVHRLQGFRGPEGSADNRVRQFHRSVDRKPGHLPMDDCPLCASSHCWGRGDLASFLDANV